MGVQFQYFAAIAATTGALVAGTGLGWSSNLEDKILNKNDYGFKIDSVQWASISSVMNIAAVAGCLSTGKISDRIGRKKTLILVSIPFIIGWALLAMAVNLGMLITGRAMLGLSCGAICVVGPVYVAEIAEKSIRGALGSLFQLQITGGILLVYIIAAFASAKVTSLICLIFSIIFLVLVCLVPETPSHFIRKRQHTEAMECIMQFRNREHDTLNEINELEHEEDARRNLGNLSEALKKKSSKMAILIALSAMLFQQLSGINAVIFYSTTIFADADVNIEPSTCTIIIGVIQIIATFIATMTVDRLGRKILLITSGFFMAMCTLSLGVFYAVKQLNPEAVTGAGWISLVSLCVFIIAFSLGYGPVPWNLIGELFSSDIKGFGSSLAGAFNWLLAFLVTIAYHPLKEIIYPSNCFFIFTIVSLLGVCFVICIVPETKGKSLKEIHDSLGQKARGYIEE